MALPFLPGNTFDKTLGKSRFHKSHFFDYNADVPVQFGGIKPGIGGERLPDQSPPDRRSALPEGIGAGQPAWVAFDRQVLRFYAYFEEPIEEKREEKYRIRDCVILFYLEDDSIQVNERVMENSGIPQGTLIRRHRIPLPSPHDTQYYTIEDLEVGRNVQFYSKDLKITGCDQFTKNFLTKIGVKMSEEEDTPNDPYTQYRKKMLASMQPHRPYEKIDTLKQFLDHDREVLRFYCHWDDTDSMFGDQRHMELHYFLSDDTIEVQEKIPPNAGRDAQPMFLQRAKLPKNPPGVPQPGVKTKRTVLNVFGPTGHGGRHILDALKTGAVHDEYYHESDLGIGSVLNVWGRRIVICDADNFTKNYYKTKYGVDSFDPIQVNKSTPRVVPREVPPYNGFGSEEDSLASCQQLIPKPPKKDFAKFMKKDRQGLDSNVLRFVARMKSSQPVDADRMFIVFYYLSDDTIAVFEPPMRNSGIIGGKFLERGRVARPEQFKQSTSTVYYQAENLYIGAEVTFNNFKFIITDADEYALRYMESHSGSFPHSNIQLILAKLKGPATAHVDQIRAALCSGDPEKTGRLPYGRFRSLVKGLAQVLLNEHEILTLAREYGERKWPPLPSLIRTIQDTLKMNNYKNFSQLFSAFQNSKESNGNFISKQELEHVCRIEGLPLSDQLIQASLMNCVTDDKGYINYHQFVSYLDWADNPLPPETNKPITGASGTWAGMNDNKESVCNIAYERLLQDLTLS